MANKYQRYTIQITYLNGNKENIEYTNFKNANTSSRKEMLEVYRETKEMYKNESVTIDFLGVTPDEQLTVLFSKEIKAENEDNLNSFDLIEDIYNKSLLLKQRKEFISDKVDLVEKEKSIFEHKNIEFCDTSLLSDEYKIQAFNEYRSILLNRRNLKNEYENLIYSNEHIEIILDNINQMNVKMTGLIKSKKRNTINAINNEVPVDKDKQIIKEIPYKNFKERINLMKQLEGKFDRIINDEIHNKLKCYKKSKVC